MFEMPASDSRALDTSAVTMDQRQGITSSPAVIPERIDRGPGQNANSFYSHNSPSSSHDQLKHSSFSEGEALMTRSAFEITSVSNAPPDGEDAEGHASKDAEELKRSLLEVEESMFYRVSTSSGESIEAINDDSQMSLSDVSMAQLDIPPNPSPKLFDPAGGNGPQASGTSRFRRINNYQRGRWLVTDIFEPEERSDSEMKMSSTHLVKGDTSTSGDVTSLIPGIQHKSTNNLMGMEPHPQDGGHFPHSRSSSEISNPLPLDSNMRDPLVPMDKQSSTAESIVSLSRTGSLSSVVKSVDEEERVSGDIDDISEPVATHTPDLHVSRPTCNMPTTFMEREHFCSCDVCSSNSMEDRGYEDQAKSIGNALFHLQEQLNQFVTNNSQQKTIDRLSHENARLTEKITQQQNELDRLHILLSQHNIPMDPPT